MDKNAKNKNQRKEKNKIIACLLLGPVSEIT